jgi:ribosomal protein S18 acetylase RimI-like enzyme
MQLRGMTRENAISVARLASLGITEKSWAKSVGAAHNIGYVCTDSNRIVGYCFGDRHTGEIVVLALLPDYECRGIGKTLLSHVVADLRSYGFERVFLGCSKNPDHRSYGFYRYLGWRSTGTLDSHGDEVLELLLPDQVNEA